MRLFVAVTDNDWFALHASRSRVVREGIRQPSGETELAIAIWEEVPVDECVCSVQGAQSCLTGSFSQRHTSRRGHTPQSKCSLVFGSPFHQCRTGAFSRPPICI